MSIITDNFDTIYGVKGNIQALRDKVLELAIQGKLVEQDENDEPASELLKRIKELRNGKSEVKNIKPVRVEQMTFEIPNSWEWVNLADIAETIMGQSPDGNTVTENPTNGIEFHQGKSYFGSRYLQDSGKYTTEPNKIAPAESILISVRAPVGTLNLTDREICIGRGLTAIIPCEGINRDYLYIVIDALQGWLEGQATGSTFKAITGDVLKSLALTLPPLEEQRRIVARVEQLMAEIDKLEQAIDRKNNLITILPKTAVETISSCETSEELQVQMNILLNNFPTIFQSTASMQELRSVILQLAIEGKLVKQDPEDEPASELLIKVIESQHHISGKIKEKQHNIIEIHESDIPYEIPFNWKWAKLGDVLLTRRGASPRPIKSFQTNNEDGVNWVKIGDATRGGKYIMDTIEKITPEGAKKSVFLKKGALIMSNSMSFGKAYILGIDGCIHDGWLSFEFDNSLLNPELLQMFLSASYRRFAEKAAGGSVLNLNIDRVKSTLFPIPPLNEQHRIVEKVEALMSIIDSMEKELSRKNKLQELMPKAAADNLE